MIKKITKKLFILNELRRKNRARNHLEMDLAFLNKEHDNIFDWTEDKMREELEKARKRNKKEKVEELQRMINKYDSVKGIYGKTKDELRLVNKYIDFLKESLWNGFKNNHNLGRWK